jgi:hypothetical protein
MMADGNSNRLGDFHGTILVGQTSIAGDEKRITQNNVICLACVSRAAARQSAKRDYLWVTKVMAIAVMIWRCDFGCAEPLCSYGM